MLVDAFTCKNLTKKYGKFKAVDDINLTLKIGHIYGLVGNNGAGKTTLMRIIMGLTSLTEGEITLLGKSSKGEMVASRKHIGTMIETPIYNSNMSGRKNLELLCKLYAIKDDKAVETVLTQMRLLEKADVLVKNYSLGMRQRLGLAGALLGNPEFLVLDEPVNGLDPSGIREILLEIHKTRKVTILISSHYLEQLNLLATDYIILHGGKVIKEFTQEELVRQCQSYISLEIENKELIEDAIKLLKKKYPQISINVTSDKKMLIYNLDQPMHQLSGTLAVARIEISELDTVGTTFEEYFNTLIGGGAIG